MKTFDSARDVSRKELGETVLIDGEKVYIDAEFYMGKLLSWDGTKEEYFHEIMIIGIALILVIFLGLLLCK